MPDFAIVWPMKLIWLSDRFSRSSGRLEGLRAWGVSDEVEVADGWTAGGCGFSSGAGSGVESLSSSGSFSGSVGSLGCFASSAACASALSDFFALASFFSIRF
jgi:hypothetical protein